MFTETRTLITGLGTVPAETGVNTVDVNLDLLNMPLSGFTRESIENTPKIGDIRIISGSILRIAIAEFGLFQSTNILVVDIDLGSENAQVLATYEINDNSISNFYSIHILADGDIIIAGEENTIPFLLRWNTTFTDLVQYTDDFCSREGQFNFSFPTLRFDLAGTIEGSYSLLHSNGDYLYALVTGIRTLGNISVDSQGIPKLGIARFDLSTLALIDILDDRTGLEAPVMFDPNWVRAGFVDRNIIQFAGRRKGICHGQAMPFIIDAFLYEVDENFDRIREMNYADSLGHLNNNGSDDIIQAVQAETVSSLDNLLLLTQPEGLGTFHISSESEILRKGDAIASLLQDGTLYLLSRTHQGLELRTYSV